MDHPIGTRWEWIDANRRTILELTAIEGKDVVYQHWFFENGYLMEDGSTRQDKTSFFTAVNSAWKLISPEPILESFY